MAIPNSPAFVKGVINIRGTIVPIADLRERLGLPTIAYGETTVVVVLRVMRQGQAKIMGVIVDAMSDVTNVPTDDIKAPPDFGDVNGMMVKAIATVEEKMITIIDVDKIFFFDGGAEPAQTEPVAVNGGLI